MKNVRSAILNSKKNRRKNRISIFTVIMIIFIATFEATFLSNVLNDKLDNVIEVFAPLEAVGQDVNNDNVYDVQEIYSYEIPRAEIVVNNVNIDKPMVALTYDDGPHPVNTIRILDILSKYNAKATFFMLGENVDKNKWIPKKVIDQGSEIGIHTWSHLNLNKLSEEEIIYQISTSSKIIEENTGTSIKLLRPPYGNNNDMVKNVSKSQNKAIILWNIDTEDWKSRDAEKVAEHVLDNVKDGDIVLMHDIYSSTADASEKIVKELTDRGYQLVTISELFNGKGKPLNYGEKYYSCK